MFKYALVGKDISYSLSPYIHKAFGYDYKILDLTEKEFIEFIEKRDFIGINVTTPYKEKIVKYLDEMSPLSKKIGAVNTVVNDGKKLIGYNTDYYGFKKLLIKEGVEIFGKTFLVLGTGGASKAVKSVLIDGGAKEIITCGRREKINYQNVYETVGNKTVIVVNATVVGSDKVNGIPIDLNAIESIEAVIDIIYSPKETELIKLAKKMHVKAFGGLYMLCCQAEKSSTLFVGEKGQNFITEKIYGELMDK